MNEQKVRIKDTAFAGDDDWAWVRGREGVVLDNDGILLYVQVDDTPVGLFPDEVEGFDGIMDGGIAPAPSASERDAGTLTPPF